MVCSESCITGSGLVDACVFSQVDILPHGWSGWYLEIAKSFNIYNYSKRYQMSHEKSTPTFHYTGWLIEILIMVYYNPIITG